MIFNNKSIGTTARVPPRNRLPAAPPAILAGPNKQPKDHETGRSSGLCTEKYIFMNTTEYESAIADAASAVRNRPNDFAAFEDLGSAYFEADRLDEAMTAFQRAVALNPGTALAYRKIGWIHYRMVTPQQAMAAFEQAITNDPQFLAAYEGLGWLYISKLVDYDRAIDTYERGLAANPADPFLTAYLGSTYARMGKMEKALEILEQSAKEHPDQIFCAQLVELSLFPPEKVG